MRHGRGLLITVIFLSIAAAIACSFISVKWTLEQYDKAHRAIYSQSIAPSSSSSDVSRAKTGGFWADMTWDDTIGMSVLLGIISAAVGFAVIWCPYIMITKTMQRQQRKSFLPYQNYGPQGRTLKAWSKGEQAQG